MKKFLSMMLVVTMVMSIMPLNVLALDTVKAVKPVQSMEGGKIKIYEKDGWTYSVSEGEENIVLVAISPEDIVYQKLVDKDEKINTADLLTYIINSESTQLFNMKVYKGIQSRGYDKEYMDEQLERVEGTEYLDTDWKTGTYNGKSFRIEERLDLNYPIASDMISIPFEAGMTLASIVTAFYAEGFMATVGALAALWGIPASANSLLPRDVSIEAYYASGVTTRSTYTTGVNYVLESTAKSNEYAFYVDRSSSAKPQMVFQYTSYQHGQSYFNDWNAQIVNAYENYYG